MSLALASKMISPIVAVIFGLAMIAAPLTGEAVKIIGHEAGVYYARLADKELTIYYATPDWATPKKEDVKQEQKEQVDDIKISVRLKSRTGETSSISYSRKGKNPLNDEEKEILQKIAEAVAIYNEANKRTIPDKVRYVWQEIKRGVTRR